MSRVFLKKIKKKCKKIKIKPKRPKTAKTKAVVRPFFSLLYEGQAAKGGLFSFSLFVFPFYPSIMAPTKERTEPIRKRRLAAE